MISNFDIFADKRIELSLKEIIQDISDNFTRNILSTLYPSKVIKRFIFRPLLGKWYPYIDVKSEFYDSQLSLFFGKINMKFSKERICSYCSKNLDGFTRIIDALPIALCKNCFPRIYYGYWDCLNEIYNKKYFNSDENECQIICKDLLAPKCGFPHNSERVNPCLKNHAIGLVMIDDSTLRVIIGPLEFINYQMAWKGGLLGLIFGYSNRIMNIEILEQKFRKIFPLIKSSIKEFNNNDGYHKIFNKKSFFGEYKISLHSPYLDLKNFSDNHSIIQWILINFFRYYKNFEIKLFIANFFERPLSFLKILLKQILKKFDIEILQFIELYKYFTPLTSDLRQNFEDNVKKLLNIDKISKFSRYLIENEANIKFVDLVEIFKQIPFVNFKALNKELEIYEILCALGSKLIVKSNISDNPMLLTISDLIGRKIY